MHCQCFHADRRMGRDTVTHILGVRAFGTQLLCEQVIGRGLRRRIRYVPNAEGRIDSGRYAEVYGVPFSFIPCSGSGPGPRTGGDSDSCSGARSSNRMRNHLPSHTRLSVRVSVRRAAREFYRGLAVVLLTADLPSRSDSILIVGESSVHDLGLLKTYREQQVAL